MVAASIVGGMRPATLLSTEAVVMTVFGFHALTTQLARQEVDRAHERPGTAVRGSIPFEGHSA